MKAKTKKPVSYTNEPLALEAVADFLPPPEDLVLKEQTVKVTISLTKSSVEFFKQRAKRRRAPYQAMIRKVLDLYTARYH